MTERFAASISLPEAQRGLANEALNLSRGRQRTARQESTGRDSRPVQHGDNHVMYKKRKRDDAELMELAKRRLNAMTSTKAEIIPNRRVPSQDNVYK